MAETPQRRRRVRRRIDRFKGWAVFVAFLGLAGMSSCALKQNHDDSVKGQKARTTQCKVAPVALKNYQDLLARGVITDDDFKLVTVAFRYCD